MIQYKKGNIIGEDAEALVNSVNCVGVMGRGVALQFKRAWPDNFRAYAAACRRNEVQPGRMFVYETRSITNPRFIINFPTKRHWRGRSDIRDIESGLTALVVEIRSRHIRSIAVPPLGAGLGGLDWCDVRPRIEGALGALGDVSVTVFEPQPSGAEPRPEGPGQAPRMTPGRAALVGLMDRYLAGLMDTSVSLLEVHKLMYLMQEAGEPLKLRFSKGHYGPYAENLRHVLAAVEGYYISGYGAGGDAPSKALELVPGAVEESKVALSQQPDSLKRFEQVARLVQGFETPFGLELLSTVHWIATRERPEDDGQLVHHVYAWGESKRQFSPDQILLAKRVLSEQGWLNA